jgi:hypothetical protein
MLLFMQVYDLLRTWRDQNVSSTSKDRLRQYLNQSGFHDLVTILD